VIVTETTRLIVRNWTDGDRPLFHEINTDPEVMAFFPYRRSRDEADALMDIMRERIRDTGYGFYALELKESGEPIGFCGINRTALDPYLPTGTVEIGWRLARRFWGGGLVTEAASELLRFGFEVRKLEEIVSFAVPANGRSTAVMERIGMKRRPERDFSHPRVPDTHPHLKPHVVYTLTREEWRAAASRQA